MSLTFNHFDTKSGKNLGIEEKVENSLAEYFFPDTQFDVGTIHAWSKPEDLEKEHDGKTIQFAAQGRGYYASDDIANDVFRNDSEILIRGKLLFTPCAPTELKKAGIESFQELQTVRILVVNEETGENGGNLPPDVAKSLVGDCHGKISPDLASKMTGRTDTPFQYRMGIKPQTNLDFTEELRQLSDYNSDVALLAARTFANRGKSNEAIIDKAIDNLASSDSAFSSLKDAYQQSKSVKFDDYKATLTASLSEQDATYVKDIDSFWAHQGSYGYSARKGTLAPANLDNLAGGSTVLTGKTQSGQLSVKSGYDMILPMSGVYGTACNSLEPGEYTLDVGLGVKSLATYRDHSLGSQVLVHYPKAVEAEMLPVLKEQLEELARVASDPRAMARLYIEKYEKRQAFKETLKAEPLNSDATENLESLDGLFQGIDQSFGLGEAVPDDDIGDGEDESSRKGEDFLYRLLKADEEHGHLIEHPHVVSALQRFVRQERLDNATGRSIKFTSGLAQPSEALERDKEICVPNLPEGAKVAVYRSPLINSNGVLVLTNKHLPEYKNLKGIVAIHPQTAAQHLQGDFDGDTLPVKEVVDLKEEFAKLAPVDPVLVNLAAQALANKDPITASVVEKARDFVSADYPALSEPLPSDISQDTLDKAQALADEWSNKNPVLCAEIQEALLPENRYPDVVKNKKVPYEGLSFAEMTMAVQDDKIGLIANQLLNAIVQRNDSVLMPEDERALYVTNIFDTYEQILNDHSDPEVDLTLPPAFLERVQSFVDDFPPLEVPLTAEVIEQKLQQFRSIQGDVIAEYGNQLQRAVDTFKNSLQPEADKLAYCDALTSFQQVPWIRDKKKPEIYSHQELKSTNHSAVDKMVRQSNSYFQEDKLEHRPTTHFKALFDTNFTPEQYEKAKEIRDTYNQLIDRAKALDKQVEGNPQPTLVAFHPQTGSSFEIKGALKSKHPQALSVDPKDLYFVKSSYAKDPEGTLVAMARVPGEFKEDGKPVTRVIGSISPEDAQANNIQPKTGLKNVSFDIEPPPTKIQSDALFKEANDYLVQVKSKTPDSEKSSMAAALWHLCHTKADKENQQGTFRRATVAFKTFPDQVLDRFKELQFTNLKTIGFDKETNEHSGRNWDNLHVEIEIGVETKEGNKNQGKTVIFIDGKQLGPFQAESPQLPVGTKATATITPVDAAKIKLKTRGGNELIVEKVQSFDFADRVFNGEKSNVRIEFVPDPDPEKKRNIPVAIVDDKILGRIEYKSGQKLKEAGYLKSGVVLPGVEISSVSTAAVVKIDPETVRYPESWTKRRDVLARDENTAKVVSGASIQEAAVATYAAVESAPATYAAAQEAAATDALVKKHPTEFAKGDRFYDSDNRHLEVVEPTDIRTVWAAEVYGDNPKDIEVKLTVREVAGGDPFTMETGNWDYMVHPSGETNNYPSLSETLDNWRQVAAAADSNFSDKYVQRIDAVTAQVHQEWKLPSDRALSAMVRDLNDSTLASQLGVEPLPPSFERATSPSVAPSKDSLSPSTITVQGLSNPLADLQPLNPAVAHHMKKDVAMAEVATQFIGKSAADPNTPSSTRNYTEAWGEPLRGSSASRANTGTYSKDDIVMVSGSGPWRGVTNERISQVFEEHYKPLLDKAVEAGAQVVVGDAAGTDKLVQQYLQSKGYNLEQNSSGFMRMNQPERSVDILIETVADPVNIYSGSKSSLGAALTNPTELSKFKGNIQNSYPVSFRDNPSRPKDTSGPEKYFQDKPAGEPFLSAEDAYQHFKKTTPVDQRQQLMTEIISAKLEQHPKLTQAIEKQGGTAWLETCEHTTAARGFWEGKGRDSPFIAALIDAYEQVMEKQVDSTKSISQSEPERGVAAPQVDPYGEFLAPPPNMSQPQVVTPQPEPVFAAAPGAAPGADPYIEFLAPPPSLSRPEVVTPQPEPVLAAAPGAAPGADPYSEFLAPPPSLSRPEVVTPQPEPVLAAAPGAALEADPYSEFLAPPPSLSRPEVVTPQPQPVSRVQLASSPQVEVKDLNEKQALSTSASSLRSPEEARIVQAALSSLKSNPANETAQLKVGTIQDKYAVTFDSSSDTLRIFDSVSSRGLIYEAARNEPATVNHLGEGDLQVALGPQRDPLEQRLISAAMSALAESGSSNSDLSFQAATLADRYVVSFDKESQTLQVVDPTGERGVLYMTQMDKEAQINNFQPSEIQALPKAQRVPWEDAMLKQAIFSLNSNPSNANKDLKVAAMSTPSGSYGVSYHSKTDTIQLFDAKDGQRGIVYQAVRGATPTISTFREDEKQSFLNQHQAKSVSVEQQKPSSSVALGD